MSVGDGLAALDTQADGKPSYEARERQNSQLNSELVGLRRMHDSAIKEIGDLSRKNAQLIKEREELRSLLAQHAAYIERTKHAPLWGLALGAGTTAALLLGNGRR